MELNLADDAVLVTASSSGLGKGVAASFAREGANVVINGRDPDRLTAAVDEVRERAAGAVVGQAGDITDAEDVAALVDRAVEEFGTIDHLVTSAGGPPSGTFRSMADADWYDAFELLVMSVVRTTRAAEPHLHDGGGTITNIASTTVKEAKPGLVLSNAVRMAVVGLNKTLARELAPGIRANAVLPGGHETGRTEDLIAQGIEQGRFESYEAGFDHWTADIPLDCLGDPSRFGDIVAFLCSDRASFVNGTTLVVDGGSVQASL